VRPNESARDYDFGHQFARGQVVAHGCTLPHLCATSAIGLLRSSRKICRWNSAATIEGLEIGRVQALQAEAAELRPRSR
jgi:hypothetical protein